VRGTYPDLITIACLGQQFCLQLSSVPAVPIPACHGAEQELWIGFGVVGSLSQPAAGVSSEQLTAGQGHQYLAIAAGAPKRYLIPTLTSKI
jgi:hypothetical protein